MRTGTSEFTPLHVTKNVTEQAPIHVHVQSSQPTRNARTIDCTLHSSNSNPLWSFTASRTAFSPAAPIMLSNRRRYQIGPACDGHHGRHSGLCSHWPDAVVAHVKRRELGLLAALDGLAGSRAVRSLDCAHTTAQSSKWEGAPRHAFRRARLACSSRLLPLRLRTHRECVISQVAMSSRERLEAGYEMEKRSFAARAACGNAEEGTEGCITHHTARESNVRAQIRSWRNVPNFGQRAYDRKQIGQH